MVGSGKGGVSLCVVHHFSYFRQVLTVPTVSTTFGRVGISSSQPGTTSVNRSHLPPYCCKLNTNLDAREDFSCFRNNCFRIYYFFSYSYMSFLCHQLTPSDMITRVTKSENFPDKARKSRQFSNPRQMRIEGGFARFWIIQLHFLDDLYTF